MKHKVCIIGSVWVEPNSSAAGGRMLQLISFFRSQDWEVFFGTTTSKNDNSIDLTSYGVKEFSIELNSSSFDEQICKIDPTIVVFDRFMIEEQFGWRVAETCPKAMRILDTEDLHSLRKTRYKCLSEGVEFSPEYLLKSEMAKREVASIYRCDVSLIISTYEMELLQEVFGISNSLLCELPFFLDSISEETQKSWKPFEERQYFVSIGNFLHRPNQDATVQLKAYFWPKIREMLPKAELHIYGAYPNEHVRSFHKEKEGFFVHGFVENAEEVLTNARVLLAPLRYGAGIKGKLTHAMSCGTPSVTTNVGAEGMHGNLPWSGFVETDLDAFINKAVELYTEKEIWEEAQKNGVAIINKRYNREEGEQKLLEVIEHHYKNLDYLRTQNFIGQMLQHHTMNSYKYLSKWIEEKNK